MGKDLSVPDADILIKIAEVLKVSVSELLDKNEEVKDLNKELSKINEELAIRVKKEKLQKQSDQKRNSILFLSFITLLTSLIVKQKTLTIIILVICTLSALFILYKILALMSSTNSEPTSSQLKVLKSSTIFQSAYS